ncbi:MarR family winged helix-turn-helix transcriptional regulator [Spongiactinospora rosea]|uniref:MarR family winged helix-turn-helix transcriptional regulator n=1 Tax=Spongiactinospora rosea TaxID=2248750 RepID=UPI0011C06BD3|nr:MarR family transcriptional regulator [Spongiactinospora rosea]
MPFSRIGGEAGPDAAHDAGHDAEHDSAWMVEEASLVLVEVTLDAVAHMGDLSLTALRLLLAADRHGPLNLSRLAAQLGMSPSATGRMVDRLAGSGLLTRYPATHSRREIRIEVTAEGLRVLERLRSARRRRIGLALRHLTPEGRRLLTHVLQEFTEIVSRQDDERFA